ERIRFPVVAEEQLLGVVGAPAPATEELGQLESDVLAELAELAAPEQLQLVLEDDAVVRHAVELELVTDGLPDLRRAGGGEVDGGRTSATGGGWTQALQHLGDAGDFRLVLASLARRLPQLAQRIEVAAQVCLVEIPATGGRRGRGRRAGSAAERRQRAPPIASAIAAGTRSRTALAATFTAFATACACDRPWHLMKSRSKPRIGEPPYRLKSVSACTRSMPCDRRRRPTRHTSLRSAAACTTSFSTPAIPSSRLSTTFPTYPSHTITSAIPRTRSLPSTFPTKSIIGCARSRRFASTSDAPPLVSSRPMLRRPTRGFGTLEMRRA